jgi:hypothetical protein
MITWTFEGMGITFQSTPENFDRDILKMAKANKINPETKTRIIDGSTNNTFSTDAASSDGDTSNISQPAISVDAEEDEAREPEANKLPTMSGDLDDDISMPSPMEPTGDDGNTSWAGDWFDGQPNR